MAIPSLPYPLTDGTFAYGSEVFADLSALLDALNADLDSTNINIAVGIGANYIVSGGAGGASGAFQAGAYSFTSGNSGQTALAVNGVSGQSANPFQVNVPGQFDFAVTAAGVPLAQAYSHILGGYALALVSNTGSAIGSSAKPPVIVVGTSNTGGTGFVTIPLTGAAQPTNGTTLLVYLTPLGSGTNLLAVLTEAGSSFTVGPGPNIAFNYLVVVW